MINKGEKTDSLKVYALKLLTTVQSVCRMGVYLYSDCLIKLEYCIIKATECSIRVSSLNSHL